MFTNTDKNVLRIFNFERTNLKQTQFEQIAQLLLQYLHCYATSKFDVDKIKVELNLPLKATAVLKIQSTRIPLHLQKRVQHSTY